MPPRAQIVFAFPFSLQNHIIVCHPIVLSLSPDGIAVDGKDADNVVRTNFIAFEKLTRIETEGSKLRINKLLVSIDGSAFQTTELAKLLKRLKKLPSAKRLSEIENELARRFDPVAASSRLSNFSETTFTTSLDSLLLLLSVFAISPIFVWRWGLAVCWPYILGYLILNAMLIAWDFWRADQQLFSMKHPRWSTLAMILLSPATAARATKYLAKDIGSHYPLGFAFSSCSDNDFKRLASWTLRDSMFQPERESDADQRLEECALWFRCRIQNHILALVGKRCENPDVILLPELPESSEIQSYCPRCLSQFVIVDGKCSDCGGLPLRPFKSPLKGTPAPPHDHHPE